MKRDIKRRLTEVERRAGKHAGVDLSTATTADLRAAEALILALERKEISQSKFLQELNIKGPSVVDAYRRAAELGR